MTPFYFLMIAEEAEVMGSGYRAAPGSAKRCGKSSPFADVCTSASFQCDACLFDMY
jgi:hypothetical protein